ncbi:CLUMA_CG000755, isoform C [Clunio marinus]|uniref:CLUMA_CG000755, isoform C n=1 Tax=Clunio marinus TaxID=568069 RepID=A0A1J1HG24_9DIPT|nr:CLUMA_CG000755, isoform C [Clunio marinus]
MTMSLNEKRMLDREALRSVIQQWNANRLDLFELSEPNENLEFHGVMRFYFQDVGQKVATKCIRVASDATVADVIETLIEKFRPDMRMLSVPNYALYEVHANGEERKLNPDEKPLLVQLNWHVDDREGRFLLKDLDQKPTTLDNNTDTNFKRKLSKREKKEQKKKEKLQKLNPNGEDSENHVAEKLYTELPETSFTRSISNPEAVMRRRRQQKLEKKLQQFRARDGGPDTGGTLKIYGESLCRDVPYKTLLLSIRDCAQAVVREMLAKYGMDKADPLHYCLVQVNSDGSEYILDDDECPLSILMNHPTSRGSIMFHVRRRPAADTSQPRRRKKKPLGISNGSGNMSAEREGPVLIEITHSGDGGRRLKLTTEPVEVGSANTNALQLFGPSIQPRHCLISLHEGVCTVTPLHADGLTFVNGHHITQPTILHNGSVVMFGRAASYRFVDVPSDGRYNLALSQSQLDSAYLYENRPQSFAKPPAGMSATPTMEPQGQEAILPAVLEFPEHHQEQFLKQVISELDVNSPNFKLAPVYTLYLCARYRASTHYRPDLQPTERAHKLTVFLHHVANLIHNVIQEKYNDPKILSFWMANSSEFLHFLKSDRHISAFSVQAQEVLAECVQTAFQNLVSIFHSELSQTLNQFLSENIDHDSAAGLVLSVLGSAMALLRRCRVNAALTIQLFSQLFHYINVVCFNKFVTTSHMCTSTWGKALSDRLSLLELWAEKQGLELAADCHLAKINQCAEFLQAPKTNVTEVQQLACSCFRLNSLQMAALLSQETIPRTLIDATVRMAESVADELTRADGREIRLEESPDLPLALLLPVDGFSCDVVRGIPAGLVDFLSPYQVAGMCRLASQLTSIGLWTVYMHQFNGRSPSVMSTKMPQPEVQTIKLHKNTNGMGLSIVAAKGAGQDRLGIYIKSVVAGGAADADGRLQAGDQLLRVDGQSLIGITQERAADYLVRTGPIVTLEVAKQGAIFHGLATLLQQPSPVIQRDESLHQYRLSQQPPPPLRPQSTLSLSQLLSSRRNSTPEMYPGARRFSMSYSHEDILSNDQLDQIHFDPRYRDYRSASSLNNSHNRTRSNSLNSMGGSGNIFQNLQYRRMSSQSSPPLLGLGIGVGGSRNGSVGIGLGLGVTTPLVTQKRWDTNPSIFIEEYQEVDQNKSKTESIKTESKSEKRNSSKETLYSSNESLQPLSESDIKSFGDLSKIPFIDDDDSTESAPCRFMDIDVDDGTKTNGVASSSGQRNACRKTVSFDVIASGPSASGFYQHLFTHNGGRRMSERDMTRVGADVKPSPAPGPQLLNSKSVPTLHHIGNASNKSRSVHSLVGPSNSAGNINTASATDQGFYQNLSVYRQQNQSQPNLGDNRSLSHQLTPLSMQQQQQQQQISGSNTPTSTNIINRPASAFFNNSNNNNVMNQQSPSTPNIPSTQSTSTGNLMQQQPMVGFNQLPSSVIQAPHAHISHPNLSGQSNINRPPMLPNKMIPQQQQQQSGGGNGGNFMRDIQSQHSLRMTQQQMMAPSMPNIAHASGYANNISASQSMQNMNQMSAQNFHPQSPQKQLPPTAPKPQRHPMDEPSQLQIQPQPQPPLPPSSTHPLFKSPITQQPSTAQQQNSTSATLSYNVNSNDVQSKAGYYQQQPQQQSINKSATSNPWEREERERENEMRREQLRHWRDQQIVELSLLPSRSPQQEEQLKTLVLERDFERRAQEEENEEENEAQYQKNQEILRLQPGNNNNVSIPPSQTSTAATRLKQVDIKTMPTNISPSSEMIMNSNDNFQTAPPIQPKSILKSTNAYNNSNPSSPSKHAKVTSFAPKNQNLSEITMNNTNANQMLTQINKEMSEMTIEYQAEETNGPMMPPPPPERGSSFAVMQHQKVRTSNSNNSGNSANFTKLTFNDPQLMSNNISGNVNNNNNSKFVPSTNNNEHSPMVMMSPTTTTTVAGTFTAHQIQQQMNLINNNVGAFTRDNKRVSFHDHENNNNNNINNNVEIIGEQDLSMIREDPNRFIDETAAMLQSPQSPDGDTNWSIQVQSTPGVIGAQEVYRDPRQRRLAEQQQKKSEAPVPEKLTFKEKMKMFALESGENTPKDKLKISRAQRDIDAVH